MFPSELLLGIFQHLPIYSQRQCLFVCKSWNAAARPFTELNASTCMLYGRNCLYRLARNTSMDANYGRDIRRLELYCSAKMDHFKIDLIHILERCHNLAEIIMHMYNPLPLVSVMIERRIHLPHLELILVENMAQTMPLEFHFLNLASVYKATLNQLHIRLYTGDFSRFLAVDNISGYLQEFVSLKHLSLATDCPLVLDSLLEACPQLQRINLYIKPARFQVKKTVDQEQGGMQDSQLEVLEMDCQLMSEDLYMYLVQRCRYLVRLILCNPCKQLGSILSTFHAFDQDIALQIVNLTLKNLFPARSEILHGIGYWFPTVRQVELRGSNLTSLIDQHRNVLLDFNDLNLHYLSIDLDPIFNHSPRFLDRVALELVMDEFTGWWQRDGTPKSRQLFYARNSKQYLHASARHRRILSNQTAVITIKAEAILVMRVHFLKLDSNLDQTIMPLNH
ncbi:hypothetical protein MAM1_0173d07221 [Mucor ambiguus]|uniref:F-box domain-containing protein n=1 Tax=Mucor ambiguus TaxID=91626 RepID=A0A0C9MZL6_9FUNG|nr:hypothetical protein MAM1_0173d07221 [Mucor ambiguus]